MFKPIDSTRVCQPDVAEFGRIGKTAGDFGMQVIFQAPALLDWLAVDFKTHGWKNGLMRQLVYLPLTVSLHRSPKRNLRSIRRISGCRGHRASGSPPKVYATVCRAVTC